MNRHCFLGILISLSATTATRAEVKLPALFTDGMVLQRDMKLPVWGEAKPGEEVTVTFQRQQVITKAGADGRWMVELAPVKKTGGPYVLKVRGKNEIRIRDVLVGEVWLCSGQSNMQWSVRQCKDAKAEVAAAKFPKIRLFTVPHVATPDPQRDVKATWQRCTPQNVREFSAVAYYFGRELHRSLHSGLSRVPIGLIDSSWGGTPVEAWMPAERLEGDEITDPILTRWDATISKWPELKAEFDAKLAAWQKKRRQGQKAGRRPRMPRGPRHQHRPGNLWNGMIHPLAPFAFRGAIWYQGESNASRAAQYATLFPSMIEHWRTHWKREFPFFWVQLANYGSRNMDPKCWAELRESQTRTLRLPKTGQALAIDIGNSRDIHPKNKQEVGRRLALLAQKRVYGAKVDDCGPMFRSFERKGNALVLEFTEAENGLELRAQDPKRVAFELAQGDGKFVPAVAKLVKGRLHVTAEGIEEPTAVRYAWRDDPSAILFDKSGLPACPFRSDTRPRVTRWKY